MRARLTKRKITIFGLFLYVIFIIWLCILSRAKSIRTVNALGWSFHQLWNYWWTTALFPQVIGNVLLYIPVGAAVAYLAKRNYICISTIIGAGISGIVEITQYITARGTLDGDDFVNNVLGALLGGLFAKYIFVQKDKRMLIFAIMIMGVYLVLLFRIIWLQIKI